MTFNGVFGQVLSRYFPVNSLRERFAKGMAWVVTGSSLRQGANFIAGIIVARMLGIVDFGKLAVIQSTVLMLTGFCQAGIGLSSTKYIAGTRLSDQSRAGRIIGFSMSFAMLMAFAMGVGLMLSSGWVAKKLLPGSDIAFELRVSTIWIVFEMSSTIQSRILAGFEAFSRGARINIWQAIFLLPVVILFAYSGGLTGAILGFSAISLIGCVIGQLFIRKECENHAIRINYRDAWRERGILRMSLMVWLSGMAMNVANWFAGILLARQPIGIAEYALFNAAQRLQTVIIFIPSRIFQVSVPILSNLLAAGNKSGFKKALLGSGAVGASVTACLALPVYVFSERLMSWYGAGFSKGGGVLEIVAVTSCISSAWTIATAGLWAAERSGQMLFLDIFRGGLLISLCVAGMAVNAGNLALAYLISYSSGTALLVFALYRFTKKHGAGKLSRQSDSRVV